MATLVLLATTVLSAFSAPTARAIQVAEFQLPKGSGVLDIVAGPDGNMWFTAGGANMIGRIGMGGEVVEYGLGLTPDAGITAIAPGPDGNLWFTERHGRKVGRITTSGAITEFSSGLTGEPDIYGISSGPNGALWFTETFSSRIGEINPTTGAIKERPGPPGVYTNILQGPDGNLWFTNVEAATFVRMTPAGVTTSFGPLPGSDCAAGATTPCPYPDNLTLGPEGNFWANEARGNAIVRVTPSGAVSRFSNGLTNGAAVSGLATGPEGNIWFTEPRVDQIGRITPSGIITEFGAGLSKGAAPAGIALGPDQNLWVTENGAAKIARIIPDVPPIVSTGGAVAVRSTHATLTGAVRSRGADTSYFFQYGKTDSYGKETAQAGNGSGDDTVPISAGIKHLRSGTTYHYRVVAHNAYGTAYGSDASFRTTHRHKPKFAVKPFQMYFGGHSPGHRRLSLDKIIVLGLHRGEHVSYRCSGCAGSPSRARVRVRRARVVFPARLTVSARSRLSVAVTKKGAGKRLKIYGFRIGAGETELKRQRCYAAGEGHRRVACR